LIDDFAELVVIASSQKAASAQETALWEIMLSAITTNPAPGSKSAHRALVQSIQN
jgi:hypothetical protein